MATPSNPPAPLYCSFCGKSQNDVVKLVAGPKVFICDECVRLCVETIAAPVVTLPPRDDLKTIDDVCLALVLCECVGSLTVAPHGLAADIVSTLLDAAREAARRLATPSPGTA